MRFPAEIIRAAEQELADYCRQRIPPRVRDKIRLEVEAAHDSLTIVERRPPWRNDDADQEWSRSTIARFSYDPLGAKWAIEWPDSDGKLHPYTSANPSSKIADLLEELDEDPTCIFWG